MKISTEAICSITAEVSWFWNIFFWSPILFVFLLDL